MSVSSEKERTHFKIGSRKSKLAMVQSEFIAERMKKLHPEFTFEIVNFDTKGDKILNIALPKIGDKGLFTKELEDALETGSIDFVVHSLKDMPCQTMPDNLVITGIPEREDPSDALVISKKLQGIKHKLEDLDENSVIGTSSLRRISQLKAKYPKFVFETIRGNLQTRFAKLDDEKEKKFDAIILATAGLKRMGYEDRISEILSSDVCMHAVSQGALGIESRLNDTLVTQMINKLNDEETLLRCIAERTFLAKLEGGCSAPVGVNSKVTNESILLEGVVLDLDGNERIQDKFEIKFNSSLLGDCPILNLMSESEKALLNSNETVNKTNDLKHKLDDENDSDVKRVKTDETLANNNQNNLKHFSFILDLNIDQNKMIKAELCGLHLAQKLKERGADILIRDIKMKVMKN